MKPLFTSLLVIILTAIGHAEEGIQIAPRFSIGEPIFATTDFEARVFDWEVPTARSIVAGDGRLVYIWAKAGQHQIRLAAVTEDYKFHRWEKSFLVDSTPPPPEEETIRSLVTEAEAKILADYLEWVANKITDMTTPETFWVGWEASFPLKSNAKVQKALKIALSEPLKAPERARTALRAIAAQLREPAPPGPLEPLPGPITVTAVTYVYEKDDTAVPSAVLAALDELNRKGIRATNFEEDTKDADGQVPAQYQVALPAAHQAGLPALVVQAGDEVVRVVTAPQTREQVMEAAR